MTVTATIAAFALGASTTAGLLIIAAALARLIPALGRRMGCVGRFAAGWRARAEARAMTDADWAALTRPTKNQEHGDV